MKTWKKVSIGILVFLTLSASFVAFILPGLVKERVIRGIESATGRNLTIGKITINPFTWNADVEKVRLTERGRNVTFVSFSSARISVSPVSIIRAAPVVSELRLVSPYVHLERTAANTYNFSDLLQRQEAAGAVKKKPAESSLFSLNNIIVSNGAIDFHDKAEPVEKTHKVRHLNISLPFIGSMSYMASRYVTPSLSAVVNGAPFKVGGNLKIYPGLVEASAVVNLKDLNLPFYQVYLPVSLPVSVKKGKLGTTLNIVYSVAKNVGPEVNISGVVDFDDVSLDDRTGEPLFELKHGEAKIRRAKVIAGEFQLSSLITQGLEVFLSRDRKGGWSHSRLAGKKGSVSTEKKTLVSIDTVRMRNGRFHFADQLPPKGFRTDLKNINIEVDGFSTAPGKKARCDFSAETGAGEKLAIKGAFSLSPLTVISSIDMNSLALEAYYPYLDTILREPVKGRLDMKTELSYSPEEGLKADKTDALLHQLNAPFGKNEGIRLATVEAKGGEYDSLANSFSVDAITLSNGDIRLSRDIRGVFSYESLLRTPAASKQTDKVNTSGKPFRYLVKKFNLERVKARFTDGMKEDRPVFMVHDLRLSVNEFSGPGSIAPFSFSAIYGENASIKGNGRFRGQPFMLAGDFTATRVPLTDFKAYLSENLTVTLAGGTADTRMNLLLEKKNNNFTGKFRGKLGVRSFYCLDGDGNDLLKWESLQIDKITGGIGPFALSIDDVSLDNFYSRIEVGKDGTFNLQHLVAGEEEKTEQKKESTAAVPKKGGAAKSAPAAAHGKIKINSVTLQGGVLAFTDHHLKQEYSSTFYNLGGRISGLSSEENRYADVDLRGNLQNLSPLRITGKINPLRNDLFIDLKVSFNDIEISPFSPYSGTYLGYTIDKGKLFLNLKYRIEKKKLDSTNEVFIDQLTFGKKVESDKATNLPVRLAVALLKDRKGEIHLDLPVTGRTDDPHFSVWRVILRILKNLLVKAATSPFALLSSMFGGNQDFSNVTFPYGSSEIQPAEREKLLKLATVLRDRPGLKTEVTGYVAREQDAEGYRNELLRNKMKTQKFLELTREKKNRTGDSPDTMTINADEYSRYLMAVYRKEKFPKPRTIIWTLKDIPDEEKKKLILTHTIVTDEQLRMLARDRASAVANFLVKEGKVDPARIFQKIGDIFKPPEKEGQPASRVEFGAAAE
jgi:uncharacterized protein involved in outer membrane biogenesis